MKCYLHYILYIIMNFKFLLYVFSYTLLYTALLYTVIYFQLHIVIYFQLHIVIYFQLHIIISYIKQYLTQTLLFKLSDMFSTF